MVLLGRAIARGTSGMALRRFTQAPAPARQTLLQMAPQKRGFAFGAPRDHEPLWVENWMKNTRQGKDSMDWFFRAFNSTRIYEFCLKSSPRYYGFLVMGAMFGGYYWSRMWDAIWCSINKGKLYKDCPYVYPQEEED